MSRTKQTFGDMLRERRIAKGFSLRKFAEMLDVSPTYLSLVEQGKVEKPPTAERVNRMAELLGENADEMIAMAGRLPEDLPKIIQRDPTHMPALLREASGLTPAQMKILTQEARRLKDEDNKR